MPNYANQLSGSLDSRPALTQQQLSKTCFFSVLTNPKNPPKISDSWRLPADWVWSHSGWWVVCSLPSLDGTSVSGSAVCSGNAGSSATKRESWGVQQWVSCNHGRAVIPEAHVGLSGCIQTLIGWLPGILIMDYNGALQHRFNMI